MHPQPGERSSERRTEGTSGHSPLWQRGRLPLCQRHSTSSATSVGAASTSCEQRPLWTACPPRSSACLAHELPVSRGIAGPLIKGSALSASGGTPTHNSLAIDVRHYRRIVRSNKNMTVSREWQKFPQSQMNSFQFQAVYMPSLLALIQVPNVGLPGLSSRLTIDP